MEDDLRESLEVSLTHQIPREPFDKYIDETVYLEIQERLRAREQLPEYSSRPQRLWSKDVRLYTLLRMLGYCDGDQVFNKFEREKIGDFWLPLTFPLLKQLASGLDINPKIFMQKQLHVMSKSKQMDESSLLVPYFERRHKPGSPARTHRHLEYTKSHFEELGEIGRGGSAQVVRVQHKLSGHKFAGKRFLRQRNVRGQQDQLKYFEREVKVLQRFRHHHLVGLVASFTDSDSFLLVLDPIADTVLLDMLKHEPPLSEVEVAILDRSFNCLAVALAFLHAHSVRHRDIKPGNILVSHGRVLICDFGISLEWIDSDNGTTEDSHPAFTRRYAAPEIFRLDASRNSKTDIWSLGCVFLEIVSALKGFSFDDIAVAKRTDGQGFSSASMESWLESLRAEQVDATYDIAINWALAMVRRSAQTWTILIFCR
jgi:tRNA A-37 threonylcarbamoyl transferase component Bud32